MQRINSAAQCRIMVYSFYSANIYLLKFKIEKLEQGVQYVQS